MTAEEILKIIEKNKEKIKSFGVKRIGLFGSIVKGSDTLRFKNLSF